MLSSFKETIGKDHEVRPNNFCRKDLFENSEKYAPVNVSEKHMMCYRGPHGCDNDISFTALLVLQLEAVS